MKTYGLFTNPENLKQDLIYSVKAKNMENAVIYFSERKKLTIDKLLDVYLVKEIKQN